MNKDNLKNKTNQVCNETSYQTKRRKQPPEVGRHFSLFQLSTIDVVNKLEECEKQYFFDAFKEIFTYSMYGQLIYASLPTLTKKVGCSTSHLSLIYTLMEKMGWIYKQHFNNNSNTTWVNPRFNDPDMWHALRLMFPSLKILSIVVLLSTGGKGIDDHPKALKLFHKDPRLIKHLFSKEEGDLFFENMPSDANNKLKILQGSIYKYFFKKRSVVSRENVDNEKENRSLISNVVSQIQNVSTRGGRAYEVDQRSPAISSNIKPNIGNLVSQLVNKVTYEAPKRSRAPSWYNPADPFATTKKVLAEYGDGPLPNIDKKRE